MWEGGGGQDGLEWGGEWDNCNSIINKLKKNHSLSLCSVTSGELVNLPELQVHCLLITSNHSNILNIFKIRIKSGNLF